MFRLTSAFANLNHSMNEGKCKLAKARCSSVEDAALAPWNADLRVKASVSVLHPAKCDLRQCHENKRTICFLMLYRPVRMLLCSYVQNIAQKT